MKVWLGLSQYRRIYIPAGVTIVHAMAIAWLLPYVFQPTSMPRIEAIELQLAELQADAPAPTERADPIAPPDRASALPTPPRNAPDPPREAVPTPEAIAPEPREMVTATADPAPSVDAAPHEVLTQNETAPDGVLAEIVQSLLTPGPSQSGSDTAATPEQLATVLAKSECLSLKRHPEEKDCPATDPFVAAAANAERAIPPERLFEDPRYIAKTASDKIFEAEAAKRFLWPDADLFADPLPPGAYNARRIRNGQEPLWSQDMRDGFRKKD